MRPLDTRLLRHAAAARRHIALCVALGVVAGILVLIQAELLATGIARVVEDRVGAGPLVAVLTGLAMVVAGRAVVAGVTDGVSHRSAASVKSELRRTMVAHVAGLGPAARGGRAEVATLAVDGLDGLDPYFSRYLPQLALAGIVPVVVIVRLLLADLTSAVIVVVTVPLIPVFMILIGKTTEVVTARRWKVLSRLAHHFLDVVSGLPTLKVFGRAKAQAESVRRITDEYRIATMATLRVSFLSAMVLELAATLSVALVAVAVGLRLVNGHLDLATGLLVIILAPEAYFPIREVGARFHAAADGLAVAEKVFALLDTPVAPSGSRTDLPDIRDGGRLRIRHAGVAHPGRVGFAPEGVDLEARAGELVAVVGPSGVGKTSLLAAVLGATPLDTGQIVVAGGGREVSLDELDLSVWRRGIAWVDQNPYLVVGTVADNVRLADPAASDEAVRNALEAVGLGDMPLDRPVGESGIGLSAGERRRVALARAVVRDAPLVLLDEPTAGLDQDTEKVVMEAIRRLADRSAVLMAAHRPGAVAAADRVVLLHAAPFGGGGLGVGS